MDARYARNIPALTEAECERLKGRRVLVVGCGGLGGHIIDQLARIGIGAIRVVDGDVFEKSNLNRQLLSDTEHLGSSKALTAAAHIARVNPEVAVEAAAEFLTEANAPALIAGCDIGNFVDSLVAPLSLINALIVAIVMRNKEKATQAFESLENIWDMYKTYKNEEN